MMMKINTKITNMQIMTPMVSTKTKTASVSGLVVLLICSSKSRATHKMTATGKSVGNGYLNGPLCKCHYMELWFLFSEINKRVCAGNRVGVYLVS